MYFQNFISKINNKQILTFTTPSFYSEMSFQAVRGIVRSSPLVRGMLAYSVIWPTAVVIQERYIAKKDELPVDKMIRYGLFATFYVAPTVTCWMKIAKHFWPKPTFNDSLKKALVEQVTYTPFGMVSFYMGMNLLQGNTVQDGVEEIHEKFWPTYQVGAIAWPCAQMINYTLIAEKNRIGFLSVCSLLWSTFLAYMKKDKID